MLLLLAAAAVLLVGVVMRFRTPSALWLDEVLTVNIASVPLDQLAEALRRDGNPPLFYTLLHVWMKLVGDGDTAVRALSGIFSVASLVPMWYAGRRLGGRTAAGIAVLLLATSPFALRYATEARMYSLLILLTLLALLALVRALESPRPLRLLLLALATGALLLTHYWSFYFVAVTGLVVCARLLRARTRGGAVAAVGAMIAGAALFVPWLPVFLFQAAHTGTPWAEPGTYSEVAGAVRVYAGYGGLRLSLIFLIMAGLAVVGRRTPTGDILLDLKTEPVGRTLAIVCFGTLTLAITAGLYVDSAYKPRYAAVVLAVFLLLVTKGFTLFGRRPVTYCLVAAAVIFGLVGGARENARHRTRAVQVAAVIDERGQPGDVVVYCPDQLGPPSERLLGEEYRHVTFPDGGSAELVDWVDYQERNGDADALSFARSVEERAGGTTIWVVSASGYSTFGRKCEQLVDAFEQLGRDRYPHLENPRSFRERVDEFPASP